MPLYPLTFRPRLVEKLWGGRKLETVLGKHLPPDKPIGESWELFDFPPGVVERSNGWVSSEIADGPLAGRSLHWAVGEFGQDLYGDVSLVGPAGQFPILIKFLDAREDLSVQVHPDHAYATKNPGVHLKTEAWFVLQRDRGSRLLAGLRPGTTRENFEAALRAGDIERLVNAAAVEEGQCYYLPSGNVHALGAGILVAEVQTPSDTTFRVFDFNRVDPSTGKQRELHVEQALQCIDFSAPPQLQQVPVPVEHHFTTAFRLVSSPYFDLHEVRLPASSRLPLPYREPVVWIMLGGHARLATEGAEALELSKSKTVLFPAHMPPCEVTVTQDAVWLEVTFPQGNPRKTSENPD
jgi:mannose-6-phosphate isomerase